MLFERFNDSGLSQYSYLVACERAGIAAVVDPRRDIDVYLQFADERQLRIAFVAETHIHADFASGARELAAATGAELCLSAYDAGELYDVRFAHRELHDGDAIELGRVRLEARHTPGHTPEHLAFLVYDGARSADVPMVMLSGDFLFVGSLGRPDLLGEEAKRDLARRLFRSVRTVLAGLPDGLEIAPGHGAGSMCGAGMSGRAVSTLGFERVANPYLQSDLDEETFVDRILANVPPFPDYYRRMKQLNADGPPPVASTLTPGPLAVADFARLVESGAVVVDVRDQGPFGAGHVPGSLGIGAGSGLSTWAAWSVPYDRPILLVLPTSGNGSDVVRSLVRVGLDRIEGCLSGGFESWVRSGRPFERLDQMSASEAASRVADGTITLIDVRDATELKEGYVPGARHVPAYLFSTSAPEAREVAEGPGPIAFVCASGHRSTVAASLVARTGRTDLANVTGGMQAWRRAGLDLSKAS